MSYRLVYPSNPVHQSQHLRTDKAIQESLPSIVNREAGHMQHIIRVESVVPQLVQHDLVSREILHVIQLFPQLVDCQQ